MGKVYDDIPPSHFEWIRRQHMFFVATAPLGRRGHVNVSPKGTADCFHVVDSKQVWYEDLTGSGVETISHVRENGRITIMFCALEGPPRILRLFGIGAVHEYGSEEYHRLVPARSRKPGSRAAIVVDVYQVGTSCGWGVPLYDYVMHRTQLLRFSDKAERQDRALAALRDRPHGTRARDDASPPPGDRDAKGSGSGVPPIRAYWLWKNTASLDGLPGLLTAPDAVLDVTPRSHFDEHAPRPMLRRGAGVDMDTSARDRKWFAAGFMLGAVMVFAVARLVGGLKT